MRRFARRRYYRRQYLKRVLRPVRRLDMTPEGIGRTMLVGAFWGLSTLLGLQLVGVALTWLVVAKWLKRPFNLALALLVTNITNPLTIAPLYSLYYGTGCAVLPGCRAGTQGVRSFLARVHDGGIWQGFVGAGEILLITGLGSVPFVLLGSLAAYWFGRYIGRALQDRGSPESRLAAWAEENPSGPE